MTGKSFIEQFQAFLAHAQQDPEYLASMGYLMIETATALKLKANDRVQAMAHTKLTDEEIEEILHNEMNTLPFHVPDNVRQNAIHNVKAAILTHHTIRKAMGRPVEDSTDEDDNE
ncbi:hypothetical protein V757_02285 [Pelistega indica]|uniref:Uncharacterized protein n=1 Tax=Pelistega indica TaxID=1414851 RepID=V8GAP5_9BURK|nr:hypothetical protein [Pelistega indica]ETD72787.1 hypothetical protein V757_02285 [Pelistega indica]